MMYGTTRMQQLEELKRELKMRQKVYPHWIDRGKISRKDADHRLNCLLAIVDDFEERHKPTADQGSLGI